MFPGDIWDVPYMPQWQWNHQPQAVWDAVYSALRAGWSGKVSDAQRLCRDIGFGIGVATKADELGAPVGQMFTACAMRRKAGK